MNRSPFQGTSLILILLTFLTGMALGWLLNDLVQRRAPASAAPSPSASAVLPTPVAQLPTASPPPSATPAPTNTAMPTLAPTATPAPTDTAEPTEAPSSTPTQSAIDPVAGYAGHQVAEGETLDEIAERGGSTTALIQSYNLLAGTPEAGRDLIVPQLAGRTSTLENAPLLVQRGRSDHDWVALTLDAGAGAGPTERILAVLRERGVKITFFLTGAWIRDNPELVREIVADGHEIANHTLTHPDLRPVSDDQIRQELADTDALMRETAGVGTRPFFRPPYGAYDRRVLQTVQRAGYLSIYWTLDSLDSVGEPKTPEFLVERVTAKLSAEQLRGAIILAHCGSVPTADALPAILDRFAEMGFEVKKVSEVLGG
jgi:peptidoglycan/xylan/chitin deacetylase (PgdA/CDA1 family)